MRGARWRKEESGREEDGRRIGISVVAGRRTGVAAADWTGRAPAEADEGALAVEAARAFKDDDISAA